MSAARDAWARLQAAVAAGKARRVIAEVERRARHLPPRGGPLFATPRKNLDKPNLRN